MMPDWQAWGYRVITGQARGPAAALMRGLLLAAAWGYGGSVRAARGLYDLGWRRPVVLPCPVVSIGNLTWGGTGKTPMAARLAVTLAAGGLHPAILTRGYGGDEPEVLRRLAPGIPVIVGADRVAGGRRAIQAGANLLVLDDGFQYWRLHRDLDIVLVDGRAPFGPGRLVPSGTLREPRSALRRAGLVVVTKVSPGSPESAGAGEAVRAIHPAVPVVTAQYRVDAVELWPSGKQLPVGELRGVRVGLVSGIADPASFEDTVRGLGAVPVVTRRFLDHHRYTVDDLSALAADCRRAGVSWLLTTLKDAVRWPVAPASGSGTTARWPAIPLDGLRLGVVHVTWDLDGEEELLQRIRSLRRR